MSNKSSSGARLQLDPNEVQPERAMQDEPESVEVFVQIDSEVFEAYYNHDEQNWWVKFGGMTVGHRLVDTDEIEFWYY